MNTFEQVLLAALVSAEQTAPAFVTSQKGTVYLNASEEFVNNLITALATKNATPAPAPTACRAS